VVDVSDNRKVSYIFNIHNLNYNTVRGSRRVKVEEIKFFTYD